jgi:hypothetical protein
MLKNRHLKEWSKLVSARMPNLSIPQVLGLATWSHVNFLVFCADCSLS